MIVSVGVVSVVDWGALSSTMVDAPNTSSSAELYD
jgi:hypothetical protein